MDIWEANREATVFTPHTCSKPGSFLCTGDECGRAPLGVCDKPGCGVNPYRLGVQDFYGVGKTIDTSKPFTVVTQFITSDGTDAGDLAEIRRIYYQGGRMITSDELADATRPSNETSSPAPAVIPGIDAAANAGAVTQDFCVAKNSSDFLRLGGMKAMGESLRRGMVLIFSIWNSDGDFMNWLDSGENGPCSETEGNPELILRNDPDVSVTFMNVRWGEIGSTTMNLTAAGRVAAQVANGNALGLSFAAARPGVGSLSWMLVAGILVWFLA